MRPQYCLLREKQEANTRNQKKEEHNTVYTKYLLQNALYDFSYRSPNCFILTITSFPIQSFGTTT